MTPAPAAAAKSTRSAAAEMSKKMVFDNHDSRLKYYHIFMKMEADTPVQPYELPAGYAFVTYREGDRDEWIAIERSAKELSDYDQGVDAWNRYYAPYESELPGRMYFITAPNGEKIATVTAFFELDDPKNSGRLHWVAIRREYQGRGLARPLISMALQRMRELGHGDLYVSTQTNTWLAARLYMDFGFRPTAENIEESEFGYRMLKTLTNHPVLADFEPVTVEEMLDPNAAEA